MLSNTRRRVVPLVPRALRRGGAITAILTLLLGAACGYAEELTPMGSSLSSQGFEMIDNDGGVTVFKDPDAEFIRVAAEATMQVSPAVLLAALLDYEGQKGIVKTVSRSEVLSRAPNRLVVYQRLDLPVIDDRDYTLTVTWGQERHNYWVRFEVVPDHVRPEADGVVRVPYHSGSWQLQSTQGGKATWVRLQTSIDLAGWLPKWLAKSGAADEIPKVFTDLCTLLARDRAPGAPCL